MRNLSSYARLRDEKWDLHPFESRTTRHKGQPIRHCVVMVAVDGGATAIAEMLTQSEAEEIVALIRASSSVTG